MSGIFDYRGRHDWGQAGKQQGNQDILSVHPNPSHLALIVGGAETAV